MRVLSYLEEYYLNTGWNFLYVIEVKNKFGECSDELNRLFREGKVRKRNGMNGDLIELVK
jgi:hypothetical protein